MLQFVKGNKYKLSITVILCLFAFFSSVQLFDGYGKKYTEEGLERSLIAFAIGKGLNGAISIVQGTEIALEPAGIGVILTPGQILDPANDLIERFSLVMLVCSIALGIQTVLLNLFSSFYFLIIVSASLFVVLVILWISPLLSSSLKNILIRIAIFFLILRFCIPVMAVASDVFYKAFLKPMYETSTQQLESSDKNIALISNEKQNINNANDTSWYKMLSNNIDSAINALDVDQRVHKLKMEVENLTTSIIDLIVVFTLQTILFPLLFIWLSMKVIMVNFTYRYFVDS